MLTCFQKNVNVLLNKKNPKFVIDNIEVSFDSDRENSDEENSN